MGYCQLLFAIGRDANNQYPIAWGVARVECKETLRWFLQLLMHDIGIIESEGLTIISDMQKVCVLMSYSRNLILLFISNIMHELFIYFQYS